MVSVEFKSNAKAVMSAKDRAIELFLNECGLHLSGEAGRELENNPRRVDTGNLRNSISYEVEDKSVYIGTNVEYGIYVHEGTRFMAPNRFLKNACVRNQKQIQTKAKTALSNA